MPFKVVCFKDLFEIYGGLAPPVLAPDSSMLHIVGLDDVHEMGTDLQSQIGHQLSVALKELLSLAGLFRLQYSIQMCSRYDSVCKELKGRLCVGNTTDGYCVRKQPF